jgi:hypothetical protein
MHRARRVVGARSTERRHPDAQVGDGEAVQVPRPAARDLLGLRAPQRGELALEAQPRELLASRTKNFCSWRFKKLPHRHARLAGADDGHPMA